MQNQPIGTHTRIGTLASLLGGLVITSAAAADGPPIITFDELPVGGFLSSYTSQGVTFTSAGGTELLSVTVPSATFSPGLFEASADLAIPIRADIAGGATSVSVDLVSFFGNANPLYLQAFNTNDAMIGQTIFNAPADQNAAFTLTVAPDESPAGLAGDIAYVLFGGSDPDAITVADNFTYTAIPAPSGAALIALATLGTARRRRPS